MLDPPQICLAKSCGDGWEITPIYTNVHHHRKPPSPPITIFLSLLDHLNYILWHCKNYYCRTFSDDLQDILASRFVFYKYVPLALYSIQSPCWMLSPFRALLSSYHNPGFTTFLQLAQATGCLAHKPFIFHSLRSRINC